MSNTRNTPPGISSKELQGLLYSIKNHTVNYPNVVIGTGSAAKVKITNDTSVVVNGTLLLISAGTEVAFTATTHDIAANAGAVQEAVYLILCNSSGTLSLYMGEIASGAGNAVAPETPDEYAVVGAVRVAVAAGATSFDASTDLLSAAHITDTYYNLAMNVQDWS